MLGGPMWGSESLGGSWLGNGPSSHYGSQCWGKDPSQTVSLGLHLSECNFSFLSLVGDYLLLVFRSFSPTVCLCRQNFCLFGEETSSESSYSAIFSHSCSVLFWAIFLQIPPHSPLLHLSRSNKWHFHVSMYHLPVLARGAFVLCCEGTLCVILLK